MKQETKHFIFYLVIILVVMIESGRQFKQYKEQIKELEQNNIEQAEEKEVYMNRCKMYEDLLEQNGLVDYCECR